MNKEKSVLFSHWDGGRGHISRILDVAEESKRRGAKIGLVTTDAIKVSLPFEFDRVYTIPTRPSAQSRPSYELPLYSHARSHGQRLRGLGFSRDFIIDINKQEANAIDDFKPDVVVNDYRDTIKNVTDLRNIPLVGIVQSNGHIGGQKLGWFTDVNDLDTPSCLHEFNVARESMGLDILHDERQMFAGDYQIIPSIQEIDPISGDMSSTAYVGLLSYLRPSKSKDLTLPQDSANDYIVCNIAASNRRRYGQEELLRNISDYLHLDVISTGESVDHIKATKRRLGSFIVSQYIDYKKILPSCKAFVSYGGHGSTLSALTHGVPIIGLGPFSSEQRGTLENIQSYGAGVVIPHGTELQSVSAPDMNNMKIYGSWHTSITSEQIIDTLGTFMCQDSFAIRALELAIKLKSMGGSRKVNDIIDGYV